MFAIGFLDYFQMIFRLFFDYFQTNFYNYLL
jgi:hypothetical protein